MRINNEAPGTADPHCTGDRTATEAVRATLGGKRGIMIDLKSRRQAVGRDAAEPRPVSRASSVASILERSKTTGVTMKARRRQIIPLAPEKDDSAFFLQSGIVMLHVTPAGRRREVLLVLYPGDLFLTAFAPVGVAAGLVAATPAELVRLRAGAIDSLISAEPAVSLLLRRNMSGQFARLAARASWVGGLTGEQRVACYLLECAYRNGAAAAAGTAFEVPLTRIDMADYLALNADTLSRIMTRFKDRGLVEQLGRSRMICRDVERLGRETPLAATLAQLHRAP